MKKKKLFLILILVITAISIKLFYKIKYYEEIYFYSKKYNIEDKLLLAIIKVESNFNKEAISYKGAVGLMQIMPSTARWITKKYDFNREYDLLFPIDNIEIGTIYLNYLTKKFNGDLKNILIAYNAGSQRVYNDKWKDIKETKLYIYKVKIAYFFYKYIV
ncbi:soluble lytic murein transglycosylase [Hypnocyclicus thermotrophus]|uniref:Soluble lytic murein transglycosylase n=1 Tax=Hypnocyclicus thermotrophus TaxID=1627895 RepID=A0AA46DZK4_9FUSO|nr:lytic transglycosylase domain-containing protein [Hypnocyclicus thermotrophus]TDT71854.1 soluble lytic murein transglycosylase [Hypnocyclicus thermotrophus]